MRIIHLQNILDMERICPNRILSNIRFRAWSNQVMRESQLLTFLIIEVIPIYILQSVNTISAWSNATNGEFATTIGSRHAQHGLMSEDRVAMIGIKTHQDSLNGF